MINQADVRRDGRLFHPVLNVLVSALFVLVVAPCVVAGVFYRWTDAEGIVHLVDDPAKIPGNYRNAFEEIRVPDEPSRPAGSTPSPAPETGTPRAAPSGSDSPRRDRGWWRQRVEEWRGKKTGAEEKLADAQARLRRERFLDANVGTYRRQREIAAEIATYEAQLREADRMLQEGLPEEARKAGVPPGWLRE